MRIKKIKLKNLKGVTGEFTLTESNVIVGENASGKTAILDAIRLCFIGYHPKLGKSARSLFSLASGNDMSCQVVMDTGEFCSFSLELSGNSVKKDWQPLNISDTAKIQLDPSLFFESTKANKRDTIFSILGNSDPNDVLTKLNHALECEPNSGTTLESEVINSVKEKISDIFSQTPMTNDALSQTIDFFKEIVSQASSASKRMDKTLEGLAQVSSPSQIMIQNESFYESQLSQLNEKRKNLEDKIYAKKDIQNKILDLQQDLSEAKKKKTEAPSFERINKISEEISELNSSFNKYKSLYETNLAKIDKKIKESEEVSSSFKNESLDKVLKELPDGTYMARVEIAKNLEDVATAVWEISDFEAEENRKTKEDLMSNFMDAEKAHNQAIWPLESELKQLTEMKSDKDDGTATAYIEKLLREERDKLQKLDYKIYTKKSLMLLKEN